MFTELPEIHALLAINIHEHTFSSLGRQEQPTLLCSILQTMASLPGVAVETAMLRLMLAIRGRFECHL